MLALRTVSPELVLHVNERAAFRRRAQSRPGRRVMRRRLSAVAAQLERNVDYQSSLRRVLQADEEFQRTLDEAQRTSWLTLEDALLDHAWRSNRAFFRAGVELGWRAGSAREPVRGERLGSPKARRPSSHAKDAGRETEVVLSLLDIIRKLVER